MRQDCNELDYNGFCGALVHFQLLVDVAEPEHEHKHEHRSSRKITLTHLRHVVIAVLP